MAILLIIFVAMQKGGPSAADQGRRLDSEQGGGTLINYLTYAPSPPPSDGLAADRQARGPSAEARSPPSPLP